MLISNLVNELIDVVRRRGDMPVVLQTSEDGKHFSLDEISTEDLIALKRADDNTATFLNRDYEQMKFEQLPNKGVILSLYHNDEMLDF